MENLYPSNIRFSLEMRNALKEIAKRRGVSLSQIVIEACKIYLENNIQGLCRSCHIQNDPTAFFCSKCGASLTEEQKKPNNKDAEIQEIRAELDDIRKTLSEYVKLIKNPQEKLSDK